MSSVILNTVYADTVILIQEKNLWAGQTELAGTISVKMINSDLVVEYNTQNGWLLYETHLYIGLEKPVKSAPGKFPYHHENLGGIDSDIYVIPLSEIGIGDGAQVFFAAHAVVKKESSPGCWIEETAWAMGCRIRTKGNWAMYFHKWIEPIS